MPFICFSRQSNSQIKSFYAGLPSSESISESGDPCTSQSQGQTTSSSLAFYVSNYQNLPNDLKSCLDYCSMLHDYNLKKENLVKLLVAEGLIPERPAAVMEDTADDIVRELIDQDMLQFEGYKIQVPESYRSLCIFKVEEHDFVSKVAKSPVRVVIQCSDYDVLPNFDNFFIQSLFIFRHNYVHKVLPEAYLESIFRLKFLLVLHLDDKIDHLSNCIGDLICLRYLYLCLNLNELPSALAKLQQLQTFICFNFNSNHQLPITVVYELRKLRHLVLEGVSENTEVSVGIRELVNLVTCENVYITEDIADELSYLIQLRRLSVRNIAERNVRSLFSAIMKLENLVSLCLIAEPFCFPDLDPFPLPPPCVQHFQLHRGLIKIPTWLSSMENLVKLGLYDSKLTENPIPMLQFLPKLKELTLWFAFNAKIIDRDVCKSGGFPVLERLTIGSGDLEEWIEIPNGALPCLKCLKFYISRKFRLLPEGLQNIITLEELFINGTHNGLVERLNGEENYKVRHISKLVIETYF